MREPRDVVPPPGPLAWLFPELRAHAAPPAAPALFGEQLVAAARVAGAVRIEDGPLGDCVRRFLRERLRDPATGRMPDVRLDPARPALELRLARGEVIGALPLLAIEPAHAEQQLERALAAATALAPDAPRPIPFFRTEPPLAGPADDGGAVHTRLPQSWFGLLPGDRYPDRVRALWHELLRTLHPERVLRFLAFENTALVGIDLYDEVVRGRDEWLAPPARGSARVVVPARGNARIVVIEGIDGAGKSSHVAQLRAHVEARGLRAATHKLFRHGVFHETVTDLTRLCAGDLNLHLWPLQRIVKAFDSLKCFFAHVEADLPRHDVLLFDRYAPTHFAEAIGRYHHDPWSRELLAALPAPDLVVLLDLPEGDALARLDQRSVRTVDENPYMLGRYRAALLTLAHRDGWIVLDARAPFDENQQRVRAAVDRMLAADAR